MIAMRSMGQRLGRAGAWLWLCLLAGPALAFVPSASFLMERMADQRGKMGVRRLKVSLQCASDKGQVAETLYLKVPGLVRRERADGAVTICRGGKCFEKRADAARPVELPEWSYLPYWYFVDGEMKGSHYHAVLESLQINLKEDTLSRFFSRHAVVLGAKNWERDRPQFWVDKDRFLPLRLMVNAEKSLVDILWIDWGSKSAGDWFPSSLEIRSDGKVLEHCEVEEVDPTVSLPEELFKL